MPVMKMRTVVLVCFFLAACGSGNGAADYALAVKYMRGDGVQKDEAKAMSYLTKAVEAGNPNAQLGLGYYYLKGTGGIQKDPVKALNLFTQAAEQGNPDAQYNVGLAYVRGEGVVKDLAQAYTWFEKAAYQDDAGAQYNVGVMSINGEGRAVDPLVAYVWFRLANDKQYNGAKEGMDVAMASMNDEQKKQTDREYSRVARKIKRPAGKTANVSQPL